MIAEETGAQRYPLQDAVPIAEKFIERLLPHCVHICIAGSIRRRKPFVKDIEILLVSQTVSVTDAGDFFGHSIKRLAADLALEKLLEIGVIVKRPNVDGHLCWGQENKLATHVKSGMPVDFFFTTPEKWFNALVVRTGPTKSNKAIAEAAMKMGWNWHAYGDGFTRNEGEHPIDRHRVTSEMDCFHFVNLPHLAPEKR